MRTDEKQTDPLAPPETYRRSDEEYAPDPNKLQLRPSPRNHEHTTSKCCVYILLWFVISAAIALVFALVLFCVETPKFRLADVTLLGLQYAAWPNPFLNATMIMNVTVNNTNFGRYKFENGTSVSVLYAGHPIGDKIAIDAGRAKARGTKRVNVTLEVRSSWLNPDMVSRNLSTNLNSGMVEINVYGLLRGKVRVMNIINRRKSSEMNCTITLDVSNRRIQNLGCI